MNINYKGFFIGSVEGNKNLYWTATRPDDVVFVLGTKKAAIEKLKTEFLTTEIPYARVIRAKKTRKRKAIMFIAKRPQVNHCTTPKSLKDDDGEQRF